jgi:hemoglobin
MAKQMCGVLCLCAAAALAGASAAGQAPREPRAISENRALDEEVRAAVHALDAEKLAGLFWKGPDTIVVFPDATLHRGWENIRQAYLDLFGGLASVRVELSDLSYAVAGDGVVGAGNVHVKGQRKQGPPLDFTYRFTSLRRKQAGRWVFVVRHAHQPPPPGPQPTDALYKRLGGYDAIAAVVDDFLPRLVGDPQLKHFFGGVSADSAKRIRQMIVDQLCAATGGPCVYIGRDMKTAHTGLGISSADWNRSVELLVATLDKFQVPAKEKADVLAALSALKADIVEK